MAEAVVSIYGLPVTCNPMKIKLLFESECKVSIKNLKVGLLKADIILKTKEDADLFRRKLPKCIKFGENSHTLSICEDVVASCSADETEATKSTQSPDHEPGDENEKFDSNTIHDWYSLDTLPSCKYGLLVQSKEGSVSPRELRQYFENNQISCGGPILKILHMVDGALIIFQNEKTAEKVWNFRPHRISTKPVKALLKAVPAVYQNKLLVSKTKKEELDEKQLEIYLVESSSKKIVPANIKLYNNNTFLITYSKEDTDDIKSIMTEYRMLQNDNISYLPITDCLRVDGVLTDISNDEIMTLFENKQRTGGGPVTHINRLKESLLLVYFASYEDAQGVFKKFQGKTLPVFNRCLKISLYFHFMHDKDNVSEMSSDKQSKIIELQDGQFRWLVDCKMIEQIRKDYSVLIICNEDKKTITLTGTKEGISDAHKAVSKLLQGVTRRIYVSKEKECAQFLFHAKSNPNIAKRVFDVLQKQKMNAILTTEADTPFLYGYKNDLKFASDEMDRVLTVCEFAVPLDVSQTNEWELIQSLVSDGLIQTTVQGSFIKIVGFQDSVQVARETLRTCLVDEVLEEWFELQYGKRKHLFEHCDFNNICLENSVTIEQDRNGMLLKGHRQSLNKVLEVTKELTRKILHGEQKIRKFRIEHFLQSTEGNAILKHTSSVYKTTILWNGTVRSSDSVTRTTSRPAPSMLSQTGQPKSSVKVNHITISVRQGDITNETSDVIVNCTGDTFNLSVGMVSKAILQKGGKVIQQELFDAKGETLRVTSSGSLLCKRVFHVVAPAIQKHISICLWTVFREAEKRHCPSLSIPAVGTGTAGMLSTDVARVMMETIYEYAKDQKARYVKVVNIIVHNQSLINDFKMELGRIETRNFSHGAIGGSSKSQRDLVSEFDPIQTRHSTSRSTENPNGFPVMFGPLSVSVRQGDITEEKNDAIVNSTGSFFDLSKGLVSRAIIAKGGNQIQQEVNQVRGVDIRVTSSGKLPCRKIIHVNTPSTDKLIKDLVKVLETADKERCASISLPAIGTGNLNLRGDDVVRVMTEAFNKFAEKHPQTNYLKVVDVVIFDRSQLQCFVRGLSEPKSGGGDNKTWWQNGLSYINDKATSFAKAISNDGPRPTNRTDAEDTNCVVLHFYSLSNDDKERAMKRVLQEIDNAFMEKTLMDHSIRYLNVETMKQVNEIGHNNNVIVSRTVTGNKITVQGLKKNVSTATKAIQLILKDYPTSQFMKPNRSIYDWQCKNANGCWESLGSDISAKLEELLKTNSALHDVAIAGTKYYLDFVRNTINGIPMRRRFTSEWLQSVNTTQPSLGRTGSGSGNVDNGKAYPHERFY